MGKHIFYVFLSSFFCLFLISIADENSESVELFVSSDWVIK